MFTPKSSIGLLLLAFFVVTAPLVLGNLRAVVQVDRLSSQSDRLVVDSIRVVKESTAVADDLTELERYARKFKILGEPALIERYHDRRKVLEARLFRIGSLMPDPRISYDLETIKTTVKQAGELMENSNHNTQDVVIAIESLSNLNADADRVAEAGNESVRTEMHKLDTATDAARSTLTWQIGMLAPATIALALLFTFLVQRPVRQTGIAIRRLGEGKLDDSIEVKGPKEMRVLGHELNWLRIRLLESEQQNNQFLRRVSHELKTPLASVREGIELFVDGAVGPLNEEAREVAELVRDNSLELQRQIENLLAYNLRNVNEATVKITKINLKEIIDDIRGRHRLTLGNRNISVRLLDTASEVRADLEKIRVVLENLVSNAIRFSPDDNVVTVAAITLDDGTAIIEVMDKGPGIPEEERRFIFRPFYQGEQSIQAHALRGTGLGLSVAHDNVAAQAGTLSLINSSQGARFRITLPGTIEEEHVECEPAYASSSASA